MLLFAPRYLGLGTNAILWPLDRLDMFMAGFSLITMKLKEMYQVGVLVPIRQFCILSLSLPLPFPLPPFFDVFESSN